jgi:hypothetical protein
MYHTTLKLGSIWICYLTTLQVRSRLLKDLTEKFIFCYVGIQNLWTKLKLL